MDLTLHSFWRATAPHRVRIGLALKGLSYDYAPVNLVGGQQREAVYRDVNPLGLTPALEVDGRILTQSLAILEWLEETHPEPPILPKAAVDRATVRAMAAIVACDIHPLNNLRVVRKLGELGIDEAGVLAWAQGWVRAGFDALEPIIAAYGGGFAFGNAPTIADCCLVPQAAAAAVRYHIQLADWPALAAAVANAQQHPAFQAAHPDRQPDAIPHA